MPNSATGTVDSARMISTDGSRSGDVLVLTKPLGTGILATALKGEMITETDMVDAILGMTTLNRAAAEAMREIGVHACTDITGFGLLRHTVEMAEASGVGIVLDSATLPIYPQVAEMAAVGLIPAGSYRNREHYLPSVVNREDVSAEIIDILADPQTSGGLLIAVPAEGKENLLSSLAARNVEGTGIGRVIENHPGKIRVG